MPGYPSCSGILTEGMAQRAYTFLHTDIVGSTNLWSKNPAEMPHWVQETFDAIRKATEEQGGRVYKSLGDGLACVFPDPSSAIRAAEKIARDQESLLPLRIGIHSGPAEEREDDFFGSCLNWVAVLANIGSGGQVLLSEEVAGAAKPHSSFLLGRLNKMAPDFSGAVYQLVVPGLPSEFPSPEGLLPRPNLPAPPDLLVGREHETAAILSGLSQPGTRLISILGFGGIGKTTLASHVADQARGLFHDRVWWVNCEDALDIRQVSELVRVALEVDDPLFSPHRDLADRLGPGRALLVLDCFEKLAQDSESLESLLDAQPQLTLIVTSRIALETRRETAHRLGGLIPAGAKRPATGSAVELFLAYGRRAAPDWHPNRAELAAVKRIVVALEGVPLAIILVASRLSQFDLSGLETMLQGSLLQAARKLGHKDGRHSSLRTVISASYDLLDPDSQSTLGQLGVFRGGFERESAAALVQSSDLDRTFGLLFQSSLVTRFASAKPIRFKLLDSIIEYLEERTPAEEQARLRRAHCTHFVSAYQEVVRDSGAENWTVIGRWLRKEQGNIAALVRFLASIAEKEEVLKAGETILEGLFETGLRFEFHALAEAVLHAVNSEWPELHERALGMLAVQYRREMAWDQAIEVHLQREKLAIERGTNPKLCEVLAELLMAYLEKGDLEGIRQTRTRLMASRGEETAEHRLAFEALEARIQAELGEASALQTTHRVADEIESAEMPSRDLFFPINVLGHAALRLDETAIAHRSFARLLYLGVEEHFTYICGLALYGLGLTTDGELRHRCARCLEAIPPREAARARQYARELQGSSSAKSEEPRRDFWSLVKELQDFLSK